MRRLGQQVGALVALLYKERQVQNLPWGGELVGIISDQQRGCGYWRGLMTGAGSGAISLLLLARRMFESG